MTLLKKLAGASAVALLIATGAAFAQTTPAPATTPAVKPAVTTPIKPPAAATTAKPATAATTTTEKPKIGTATTPDGIACSAKADVAGPNGAKLTGKPRKAFRKKCMADMKKAAKPS